MLRLSDQLGAAVDDTTGRPVGRLVDLVLHTGDVPPAVTGLVVRTSDGPRRYPWTAGCTIAANAVVLEGDAVAGGRADPGWLDEAELQLGRDVLDSQIVDLRGNRVVRVADVLLIERDDGRLIVAAVDVGFGSVLRRLGLRRLGARLRDAVVPWDQLHLTSRRGHAVQLTTPSAPLHRVAPDDLARLLARLSTTHAREVLQTVSPERAAGALTSTHPEVGGRILSAMDEDAVRTVLEPLAPDHRDRWRDVLARTEVPRRRFRRHPRGHRSAT